jgi:hypothetical protein
MFSTRRSGSESTCPDRLRGRDDRGRSVPSVSSPGPGRWSDRPCCPDRPIRRQAALRGRRGFHRR